MPKKSDRKVSRFTQFHHFCMVKSGQKITKDVYHMQHCPARRAQRLAAALVAHCLLLAMALPHAHAAALQETNGI